MTLLALSQRNGLHIRSLGEMTSSLFCGTLLKLFSFSSNYGSHIFVVIFLSVCQVMSAWSRSIRSHYQECKRPGEKDNNFCPHGTVKRDIVHHVKHAVITHWERCSWLNNRDACKHNKNKYLRCFNVFFLMLKTCPLPSTPGL